MTQQTKGPTLTLIKPGGTRLTLPLTALNASASYGNGTHPSEIQINIAPRHGSTTDRLELRIGTGITYDEGTSTATISITGAQVDALKRGDNWWQLIVQYASGTDDYAAPPGDCDVKEDV